MVDYLRQNAIEGPWAAAERLLVCVGADSSVELVVRTAARLATGLNASWIALHVERPGQEEQDPERARCIDDALRLGERLGGQIERLSGHDLAGEVLRYARRENITQIVVGRSRAGLFAQLTRKSLTAEILRRSQDIAVLVVMNDHAGPVAEPSRWSLLARPEYWTGVGAALMSVAIAVGIGRLLELWLRLPNLSMVFLIPVIFCAVRFGLSASIAASLLSFLAFDFFFVDPRYEFTISQPHEFLSLIAFLLVAVITAMLASRVREQSLGMRTRAQAAQSLFEFSRKLSAAVSLDEVLWAAAAHAQKTLDMRCIVLLRPTDGELSIHAAWPPVDELDAGEAGAARWTLEKSEPAGWRTGTLPNVRFQFRPLATPRGVVGVCGFEPKIAKEPLSAQDERLLTSILEQTAIAIDRSLLVNEFNKSRGIARKREAAHDTPRVAITRFADAACIDNRSRHQSRNTGRQNAGV